ncbi:MAG: hypothetical protein R2734_14510 [Nocardioides sp.]
MSTTPLTVSRRGLITASTGLAAGLSVGGPAVSAAVGTSATTPGLAALRAKARDGVFYGAIISPTTTVRDFERQLGHPLGSRRNYHPANQVDQLLRRAAEDVAAGRLSVLSIKPKGTWRAIARGKRNGWLNRILDGLAELDGPVCFTINHEPENDTRGRGSGMTAYWHRRMTQYVVKKARRRAPNVEVIQVLMAWTFHPLSRRRPKKWLARNVSLFGIDAYNWWSPSNPEAARWVEFGTLVDWVKRLAGDRPSSSPNTAPAPIPTSLVGPHSGCTTPTTTPWPTTCSR